MQNTIAVVFDFDDTLAPESTSGYLEYMGVDPADLWRRTEALYHDGWDPVPAYLYMVLRESQRRPAGQRFTQKSLQDWGRKIKPFKGVTTLFRRLRQHAAVINPQAQLEFYVISSGIGEILRHSVLARNFTDIWACDFHYNQRGEIEFPKKVLSFTDKTRYLFQIAKGLIGSESQGKPFEVNRQVAEIDLRIPFPQMIFVGDGFTDIPCFSLVRKRGGVAFGVYDPHNTAKWKRAWGYVEDNRVSNLAPADYGRNAALTHNLLMALNRIAADMVLREGE